MNKPSITFQNVLRWSNEECRAYLEKQRWPSGPVCPKCGATEPYTITRKSRTKNLVTKLYKCRQCKQQF
ncbi:MAG: transposase, partial [Chloroflexi bacterium]|nr:transposase [Chloroflexota bacterium]